MQEKYSMGKKGIFARRNDEEKENIQEQETWEWMKLREKIIKKDRITWRFWSEESERY